MTPEETEAAIKALHAAYCDGTGGPLMLTKVFERWWWESVRLGITPEDVTLVLKDRIKRIAAGVRRKECLYLRNITGSEEAIANVMDEAAALKALMRVKKYSPAKASVLRASGRADAPPPPAARHVSELFNGLGGPKEN